MKCFPIQKMAEGFAYKCGEHHLNVPAPFRDDHHGEFHTNPTWKRSRTILRYIFPSGSAELLTRFCKVAYEVGANPLPHIRNLFSVLGKRPDVRFLIGDGGAWFPDEDHLFMAVVLYDDGHVEIRVYTPDEAYYTLQEIEAIIRP